MHELFFVLSLVIGLGLLTYGMILVALKMDRIAENIEADRIQDIVEMIQSANPGVKFAFIFMLGGTMLSEIIVKVIDLPFVIFSALFTKKSA